MGTRVYVGRLPYRASERDVETFFRGYGRIMEVIMKNGYCFVEFADYRDADDAAHDLNGRDLLGDRVHVELARGNPRGRDRYGWKPPAYPSYGRDSYNRYPGRGGGGLGRRKSDKNDRTEWRIVVENLSSRVSWQDLKDFMRQAGEVTYTDAHGKRKNEGLVEFATKADMKNAMAKLDGKDLNGRRIKLIEEKKAKQRSRSRSRSVSKEKKRSQSRSRSKSGSKEREEKSKEKKEEKETEKKSEKRKKEKRKTSKGSRSSKSKSRSRSRSRSKSPVEDGAGEGGNESEEEEEAEEKRERRRKRRSSKSRSESPQQEEEQEEREVENSPENKRKRKDSEEQTNHAEENDEGSDKNDD